MLHDLCDDERDMLAPRQIDFILDARLWMFFGVALVVRRSAESRSAFLVRRWFGHVVAVIVMVVVYCKICEERCEPVKRGGYVAMSAVQDR